MRHGSRIVEMVGRSLGTIACTGVMTLAATALSQSAPAYLWEYESWYQDDYYFSWIDHGELGSSFPTLFGESLGTTVGVESAVPDSDSRVDGNVIAGGNWATINLFEHFLDNDRSWVESTRFGYGGRITPYVRADLFRPELDIRATIIPYMDNYGHVPNANVFEAVTGANWTGAGIWPGSQQWTEVLLPAPMADMVEINGVSYTKLYSDWGSRDPGIYFRVAVDGGIWGGDNLDFDSTNQLRFKVEIVPEPTTAIALLIPASLLSLRRFRKIM